MVLAPIVLGSKPPVIPGTIILKGPKSRAQKFLELQPKITPFLAGIASLAIPGIGVIRAARAAKVFFGTGLGVGLLESAKVRKLAKQKILDPTAIPSGIAAIIEEPSLLIPDIPTTESIAEKVKELLVSAGLIGGAAAAVVGGVALGKKALEKIPKIPKLPKRIAPQVLPAALLPALPSLTTQPLGAVQQVKEPEVSLPMQQPPINITNTFNPSIKISFKKSRKFINQQLLIRS